MEEKTIIKEGEKKKEYRYYLDVTFKEDANRTLDKRFF